MSFVFFDGKVSVEGSAPRFPFTAEDQKKSNSQEKQENKRCREKDKDQRKLNDIKGTKERLKQEQEGHS